MHECIKKFDPKRFTKYIGTSYSKGSNNMVHMEVEMVTEGNRRKEEVVQPCVLQDHSSSWASWCAPR